MVLEGLSVYQKYEYQEPYWGVERGRRVRLTALRVRRVRLSLTAICDTPV
jgi:hypothetical protein